jgi:hypothetical protein
LCGVDADEAQAEFWECVVAHIKESAVEEVAFFGDGVLVVEGVEEGVADFVADCGEGFCWESGLPERFAGLSDERVVFGCECGQDDGLPAVASDEFACEVFGVQALLDDDYMLRLPCKREYSGAFEPGANLLSDSWGDGFGEVAVGVVDDGEVCAVSDERAAHGEAAQGCACGGSECVHGVACGSTIFASRIVFQLEEVVADGDAVCVGEFLFVGGDDDGCAWVGEDDTKWGGCVRVRWICRV